MWNNLRSVTKSWPNHIFKMVDFVNLGRPLFSYILANLQLSESYFLTKANIPSSPCLFSSFLCCQFSHPNPIPTLSHEHILLCALLWFCFGHILGPFTIPCLWTCYSPVLCLESTSFCAGNTPLSLYAPAQMSPSSGHQWPSLGSVSLPSSTLLLSSYSVYSVVMVVSVCMLLL